MDELNTNQDQENEHEPDQPSMQSQSKAPGYFTVLGGVCIHLVCGNLYLWGNISNYVISHFHYMGDKNANLKIAVAVLPFSFTVQSLIQPLGAYLQKRINPKIILLVGSSLMLISIQIASNVKTWWLFVFWYCICFPLGIGIVYWTPIMCGWEWFPEHKGVVSGLIISGFGFGSFIFGFITTSIANPKNLKPDFVGEGVQEKLFPLEVAESVPHMFHYCLYFWFALALVAVLTVTRNPEYIKEEQMRI